MNTPYIEVKAELLKSKKKVNIENKENKIIGIVEVEIKNKGKSIKYAKPFESFVSNFVKILNYSLFRVNNSNNNNPIYRIKKADGSNPSSNIYQMILTSSTISDTSRGLVVGDMRNESKFENFNINPNIPEVEHYDDYNLRGFIGHNLENRLNYVGATTVSLENNGNSLKISRKIRNDLDPQGAVTKVFLSEFGLFANAGTNNILITRDRLIKNQQLTDTLAPIPIEDSKSNPFIEPSDRITIETTFTITNESGLTKNFLKWLYSHFTNTPIDLVTTNNNVSTINFASNETNQNATAEVGVDNRGIVVGGSINRPTPITINTNTTKLSSQIGHSSVFKYEAQVYKEFRQEHDLTTIEIYRDFENENTIDYYLNEIGLVINSGGSNNFLLYRNSLRDFGNNKLPLRLPPGEVLRLSLLLRFPLRAGESK